VFGQLKVVGYASEVTHKHMAGPFGIAGIETPQLKRQGVKVADSPSRRQ
jgi:hypothetical protein